MKAEQRVQGCRGVQNHGKVCMVRRYRARGRNGAISKAGAGQAPVKGILPLILINPGSDLTDFPF